MSGVKHLKASPSKGTVEHYEKAPPSPSSASSTSSVLRTDSGPLRDNRLSSHSPSRSWVRIRHYMREPVAEFLGVMILVIFGNGVNCQVVLSSVTGVAPAQRGDYLSINIGWGIGTAMGVWISAGISGGHINPAVTLALATFRGFPWKKVPGYLFAQVLGGFAGAAIVYGNYFHAINIFEGGVGVRTQATAGLFATYASDYLTNVSCFFSEFLGTAVLMIIVLALNDKKNCPPPAGTTPLVLCFLVLGIGASLGMQTAYAINPARDLGPRLLTAAAGYGSVVWGYRNQYWLWCPILAPIVGAQIASAVYDLFLYTGNDGLLKDRHMFEQGRDPASRKNIPGGPGADEVPV